MSPACGGLYDSTTLHSCSPSASSVTQSDVPFRSSSSLKMVTRYWLPMVELSVMTRSVWPSSPFTTVASDSLLPMGHTSHLHFHDTAVFEGVATSSV